VVACTNRDLEAEVASNGFRQDLYYRLNVIRVHLPPLRQREGDIPLLVEHFLRRFAGEMGKRVTAVDPQAMALLVGYSYPGNVRELENIIERAVTLETTTTVTRATLPDLSQRGNLGAGDAERTELPATGVELEKILADYERELLLRALKQTGQVRKDAARLLGITFRSLRYRLAKLGIDTGAEDSIDTEPPASEPPKT
jgi:two-component system response regulator PilR (NtrC family)